MSFESQLEWGKTGESAVARFFKKRGNSVLPVYEKILDEGKGPQLFMPSMNLIAPDMLVFKASTVCWVEAKRKSAFTWHRNTCRWTTGIDLRHYEDYLRVADSTPFPVWLFFVQENGVAKDSPSGCPTGLFGNDLAILRKSENHRSDKHGASGMVYWSVDALRKFCDLSELQD